jgi:thiamine biosynthesis lipoprotein
MGTNYQITLVSDSTLDANAIEKGIASRIEQVNRSMSTYLPASEVSRINNSLANVTIPISSDLRSVLEEAQRISSLTDGAFDITLGPAVDLWGFGPEGSVNEEPSSQQLQEIRGAVGHEKLVLSAEGVKKLHDKTRIDLSAIAKGYAVDEVATLLTESGVLNFLVNIGGELKASGKRQDGQLWRIGIEKPQLMGGVQKVLELRDYAVATSGDYRNFLMIDDKKFSHTIDQANLKPVFHKLASVTVVSDKASNADALATALLSMGEVKALEFSNKHGIRAYFILREEGGDTFKELFSDEFATLLP